MKTYKLSNPVVKSDVIDSVFTGESTLDVAKSAFKMLAKYMVLKPGASNKFLFSIKDVNTNKEEHFEGNKIVKNRGRANLNVKRISVKTGKKHDFTVNMTGGRRNTMESPLSSDDLLQEFNFSSENEIS